MSWSVSRDLDSRSYSPDSKIPHRIQFAPMWSDAAKRIIDIILSTIGLLLLIPLFLVLACVIRWDSRGPIIFRQTRRGRGGRPFEILKFRTMTVLENGATIEQAKPQDPRITRVGRLLRKTSLDELPQLINVLRGEMSLVGPRPHAIAHDEYYGRLIEGYDIRQRVKPGLTGWAQINGSRGPTPELSDMAQRVRLDSWYVENRSLSLDVIIITKTVLGAAWGRGAL
ncbi:MULTISPECIES: exopolysaccharide biosynthesis polyprenyl glycosylphosphotransferase [Chelatococcus]|uniref:Exopolysaccharide biosynthesis polyprenyl glycosylphosphotransferase n=1 Tax=Chelatococcus caeni TaxID=1348468 RepID=A0A840C5N6_9HYPH|nr:MULTISPECIES: exopolysaccharide biosynthesis polyprenyl glycosylphosphotransferase [Chelatococcus]MBB4018918.1 exopolysaccharide biosynthesis polyprenyl glycosylphosphotransferase [Chelatococcus caeni]